MNRNGPNEQSVDDVVMIGLFICERSAGDTMDGIAVRP